MKKKLPANKRIVEADEGKMLAEDANLVEGQIFGKKPIAQADQVKPKKK